MKTRLFIVLVLMGYTLCAQTPVSNKGNANQTYPDVTAVNPSIQAMVGQVSISNLENSIRWMQNLGCRDAMTQEALQTQNWLVNQFESFGLDVYVDYFSFTGENNMYLGRCSPPFPGTGTLLEAGNVVAIQYGTEFPDEYIVISSHYDHPDGPGADDNASGTAGVLEIARILSQHDFKRSIMYVPFNAEEYRMLGSIAFVKKCAEENMNILGCFNLDMIGFFPANAGALAMYAGGSEFISKRLFDFYQTVANLYVTDIPTYRFSTLDIWGGDHMSFYLQSYPSLYIGDLEDIHQHPCYHELCDTLGSGVNNMGLVQGFTRATLAAVAELADGWLPPQNLRAVPENNRITIAWDAAPETAKYRLFKNNVFLAETTGTFYQDTDLLDGMEYVYYVTGIRTGTGEESFPSNRDSAAFLPLLELPYFNDFEGGLADFRKNSPFWVITQAKSFSATSSLTSHDVAFENAPWYNSVFSAIELRPFSVPDIPDRDITISFYVQGDPQSGLVRGDLFYIEATTDRITWNRVAKVDYRNAWASFRAFLNDYAGEPFVQVRFQKIGMYGGKVFIDDLNIGLIRPVPKNVRITSIQGNNALIAWDPLDQDIVGYNVYRNKVKLNSSVVTETTFTDPSANNYPSYCYQVTAVYSDEESELSNRACIRDVGIEEPTLSKVRISPNPSDGIVNIVTGLEQTYRVAVYTMYGNEVCRQEHFSDGFLDLSALSKGIYIVKIMTSQSHVAKKVVLQ